MRVVVLGQDCDPRSNAVWFEVLRQLPETELFLPVIKQHETESMSRLREAAPDVYSRMHSVYMRRPLGETSTLWFGLRQQLQEVQPELVHVVAEPWAPVAQRVSRWQWPFVIHGAENILATAPLPYRIRRTGMRTVLTRASGAVSWGHSGLAAMRNAGLAVGTPSALCASRTPDPMNFFPSPLPDQVSPLRVAYCGRLIKLKGVQTLIESLSTLPAGTTELRILGEGKYREPLEQLSLELGTSVEFLRHGSERVVADLLRWSHVVAVPTLVGRRFKEQWGRIAVEAMMCGRVVVVSDSGELPTLVGDDEMVFPHGDEQSLSRILRRLSLDRGFVERKAAAFSGRASMFTPVTQARALVELWQRIGESST